MKYACASHRVGKRLHATRRPVVDFVYSCSHPTSIKSRRLLSSALEATSIAPPSSTQTASVLVVNGYSKAGRDRIADFDCTDAAILYRRMLESAALPLGIDLKTTFLYPCEDGLPSLSELQAYDAVAWTGSELTIWKTDDQLVQRQLNLAR